MTIDYSKGKIYRLTCNITGQDYYGSTTQTLSQRRAKHTCQYKRWVEGNQNYITAFEVIKNGNYSIIWIEDYPCENKNQLEARERYYIENNECVNKNIPTRTKKEWCEANRDLLCQKQKEYRTHNRSSLNAKDRLKYHNNKENILTKHKKYREINRETISRRCREYYKKNKEKMLEYQKAYREKNMDEIRHKDKLKYIKNKDRILQYHKAYTEKHKDKLTAYQKDYYDKIKDKYNESRREKVVCECGCEVSKGGLLTHRKSKKHQEFLNSIK
jgi:hypothetical protein